MPQNDKPATPCERLLAHAAVDASTKTALRSQRAELDPLELLHRIRETQATLAALASSDPSVAPQRESLELFLSKLPDLWQQGEVRPTHSKAPRQSRHWRTRKDPFEGVWLEILVWLQQDPGETAKCLFDRLRSTYPGRFVPGQLRILQRRIRQWRAVMARSLVYATLEEAVPGTDSAPSAPMREASNFGRQSLAEARSGGS